MLLRFHRLAEDRVAPAVLFFHGASRFFHVVEGFWLDRRGMRDYGARGSVDFHDRAAAGARHVKIRFTTIGFAFHHSRSYRNPRHRGVRRIARISPKFRPASSSSKRRAPRLKIFSVAKPKTNAQRML